MKPANVIGEPVPLSLILARTPKVGINVRHLTAYPTGFEFYAVVHCQLDGDAWDPMHGLEGYRGRHGATSGDEMADEILRLGVQFADGSKATNLGPPMVGPADERPKGPILMHHGGYGGGNIVEQGYWVWPLPPPGPLAFVCEWPKYGIALTRQEIDANLIRDAATRAFELWPDDGSDDAPGHWSGYVSTLDER